MTQRPGHGIAIMGATATGKSDMAVRLAEQFDGEVVSMDSRQVYRGLDIGTAKVPRSHQSRVPHHLIDVLDPQETHSAGRHVALVHAAVRAITGRGRRPILAGGTGLYFRALFKGLIDARIPDDELASVRAALSARRTAELRAELERVDPERAAQLSANDRLRITRSLEIYHSTGTPHSRLVAEQEKGTRWTGLKIVLTMPRGRLRTRIAERTRRMFAEGWVDEVRSLLAAGVGRDAPGMRSLGYGEISDALERGDDLRDVVDRVITKTQQYAKRQETFFRSVEDAFWVDVAGESAGEDVEKLVKRHFSL